MWTFTQQLFAMMMAALTEHSASGAYNGPLEAVYLGLVISPTPPWQWASVIGNITEATYDGYARQEVVWYPSTIITGTSQIIQGASLFYRPTDATVSNTITGCFLADALNAGNLLAGLMFGGMGIGLVDPTTSLLLSPKIQLPFTPIYGGVDIIN